MLQLDQGKKALEKEGLSGYFLYTDATYAHVSTPGFDGTASLSRRYARRSAGGEAASLTGSNATAGDALGYHYKTRRDAGTSARTSYQSGIGPFTGYRTGIQSPFRSGTCFGAFGSR